ncbi:putative hemin transport protein [Mucilaginibacter oryzae]|uniref:Putative hemin transport protein n=1 Tax=Mucilaginibacter oryzae TaxID=468058 RepID=A0A316HFG3_9SPHI|nr:ChuX/HutX family heme-like substrate-binding protein [Mucilaginibacter oryzae]PWK79147.1 putative hemin transport protein [Mucilaginibacter oryzae]
MESTTQTIKAQWDAFKEQNPKVRIRDAAKKLGVSEADLLNTGIGVNVVRLSNRFAELLQEANTLGKVMALTRNDYCVHERKGIYKKATFNGQVGLVVTPDIDLRLFMSHWAFGFAVNEAERHSLQFFDQSGVAVHKIYLVEDSDVQAYHNLVNKYKSEDQRETLTIVPASAPSAELPDSQINISGFQEGWRALQDTHDFHPLLKKYQLTRTQALRLAPTDYAQKIDVSDLKLLLKNAAAVEQEIMVFNGSSGCIQIHTGPIVNLVETGPWFNVLDPDFNMHLRLDGIDTVWLVKKPTSDGWVHSIEVFDKEGNTIVQFFGKRKPGIPESEGWRGLITKSIGNN